MKNQNTVNNENGAVLVIVLVLLVALILISIAIMANTRTSLKIISNEKNTVKNFYSAEAALNYTRSDVNAIINSLSQANFDKLDAGTAVNISTTVRTRSGIPDVSATLTKVKSGSPPTNSKMGAKNIFVNYYVITCTQKTEKVEIGTWVPYPKN